MIGTETESKLGFITNDTTYAVIDAAGCFGVGIESPVEKLHVVGDVCIDGSIKTNGSLETLTSFTLDAAGDVIISADGGNVCMDDGTNPIFDFDVDGVNLKIMDDADTGNYFNIGVGCLWSNHIYYS